MRKMIAVITVLLTVALTNQVQAACVAGDITGPSTINDFKALAVSDTGIIVSLTAPTDTSSLAAYDIRWRIGTPLNGLSWSTATQMTGEPTPSASGTLEATNINGLTPNTTYYIGIKTQDACGKWSTLSNVIQIKTLVTPPPPPKVQAVFQWDYSLEDEANIDGFNIYYGEVSRFQHPELSAPYPGKTTVPKNARTTELVFEPGKTYYVSLTAYSGGMESIFSNEVVIE